MHTTPEKLEQFTRTFGFDPIEAEKDNCGMVYIKTVADKMQELLTPCLWTQLRLERALLEYFSAAQTFRRLLRADTAEISIIKEVMEAAKKRNSAMQNWIDTYFLAIEHGFTPPHQYFLDLLTNLGTSLARCPIR